jgi:hypothetical protein
MKQLMGYSALAALIVCSAGCVMPSGPVAGLYGGLYTDVSGPVLATSRDQASKMGEATAQGILGVVTGDCSIKAATGSAGITKIQHIDYHTTTVLGVWGKTTVTVYGE